MKTHSLNDWMLRIERHYPGGGSIRQFGWDFENQKPRSLAAQDRLAGFLSAEISGIFQEDLNSVDQLGKFLYFLKQASRDIDSVVQKLVTDFCWLVLRDFVHWGVTVKRPFLTSGLLDSWIDVHANETVRQAKPTLQQLFAQLPDESEGRLDINEETLGRIYQMIETQLEPPIPSKTT